MDRKLLPLMHQEHHDAPSMKVPNFRQRCSHAEGAVRHAEKRRIGTCRFADRIAAASLDCFRNVVLDPQQEIQPTCVAAIVAHFASNDALQVLSVGVGTKFLTESVLQQEVSTHNNLKSLEGMDGHIYPSMYGRRVRDCHAEVLSRRAFRRYLYHEMMNGQPFDWGILEPHGGNPDKFSLKNGVTLHMYSSSAPCGNATLKKFATMKKETFDPAMELWPRDREHAPIPPHSLKLGQLSLLLKKDRTVTPVVLRKPQHHRSSKPYPAIENDDWCPPGTTIVWSNQGSIHTCSDKLCRWNYLGLQGSLLSSSLSSPLYMTSLTVGRKFTSCICRRAICCRATMKPKKEKSSTNGEENSAVYRLNHPVLMGTGVYMDNSGILGMSQESEFGQDVRFNSPYSFVWWARSADGPECIDGHTGFAISQDKTSKVSSVATASLHRLHCTLRGVPDSLSTLQSLQAFKSEISPNHEEVKKQLLSKHPLFRGWKQRSDS